ncbi:helix-turn-helix domain-containing protein [Streptomyces sp. P6-2-1]|uniref:helix-turn-helix domain-containing protein n=1 Tax=Streptomyces sp. P6-2-1 TaxID=3422591 RepID=UPI003D35E6CA
MAEQPHQEAGQRVAATIKRLRTARGLTLRALAERSGLTPGFLSMAERGGTSLSLTSLFTLAEALETDPAALLGTTPAHRAAPTPYTVTRATDPAPEITSGARAYRVLTGSLPDQGLEGLVLTVRPTPEPSPVTQHDGEEFCYVLTGELVLHLPEGPHSLHPGDALHLKSQVPHALHNPGPTDATALWVVDHPMLAPGHHG